MLKLKMYHLVFHLVDGKIKMTYRCVKDVLKMFHLSDVWRLRVVFGRGRADVKKVVDT